MVHIFGKDIQRHRDSERSSSGREHLSDQNQPPITINAYPVALNDVKEKEAEPVDTSTDKER